MAIPPNWAELRFGATMNEKNPTYRVEIRNSGTPPNEIYGWNIFALSPEMAINLRSFGNE
jgi:hypothetical protein